MATKGLAVPTAHVVDLGNVNGLYQGSRRSSRSDVATSDSPGATEVTEATEATEGATESVW